MTTTTNSSLQTPPTSEQQQHSGSSVIITKSFQNVSITQTNGSSLSTSFLQLSSSLPPSSRRGVLRVKSLCSGTFLPNNHNPNSTHLTSIPHHHTNINNNNNNRQIINTTICSGIFRFDNHTNEPILLNQPPPPYIEDCNNFHKSTHSLDRTATTISSTESYPEDEDDPNHLLSMSNDSIPFLINGHTPPIPPQLLPLSTTMYLRADDLDLPSYQPSPHVALSLTSNDLFLPLNSPHHHPHNHPSCTSTQCTPVAYPAIDQLLHRGLELIQDTTLWTPDRTTLKLITTKITHPHTLEIPTSPLPPSNPWHTTTPHGIPSNTVLTWSAALSSQIAIRSEALIPLSPHALYTLLLDSTRVSSYNKLSLGRVDLWTAPPRDDTGDNVGVVGEVLKVVRGQNKPPMMKPVVFHSVMYGRALEGGAGYVIITRTVRLMDEEEEEGSGGGKVQALPSELITGAMLMLRLEGGDKGEDRCVFCNSSRFTSPLPVRMSKKIGLASMVTVVSNLRKLGSCGA